MKTQKRLTPRTVINIDYVTHKMMLAYHGKEWTTKFNKAIGDGNTMIMVEEDGEQVGGIFVEDYERFADAVDYNKPTYWD
jgi:hypothetical protein